MRQLFKASATVFKPVTTELDAGRWAGDCGGSRSVTLFYPHAERVADPDVTSTEPRIEKQAAQLSSQTSRAQCQTDSQVSSVMSSSSPDQSTTVPSSSTQ